ncbi:DNA-binding domain-containing protein [Blastochloris sulfoviridis]|uniref:DUF2063 domain-containing protein n=1 Tax=Blastochloris sulfoviridis TaxID=50712 RepID=A0A5M6I2D9_9HYPH|nr:DNA-binding domain-containing protein [Blastochloris sulfoviridis]KAA5601985.1 DUF2063 domain-containing protein [Blastochloris sulfoviridis]
MTWQDGFAAALLDPTLPVPTGLVSRRTGAPTQRFAVYRNNVVVGLVEALEARFPAVCAIVGDEFFRAMAGVFVRAHPPRSPLMMHYGDALPAFLETFAPVAELPFLADVARLEAARTHAYHAVDADGLDAAAFAELHAGELGAARATLLPGTTVIRSLHPLVTIWAMNVGEAPLAAIDDWRPQDALVGRDGHRVVVRRLPPGGGAFLAALAAGQSVADAIETALADAAAFDLTAALADLIETRLIAAIHASEVPS